MRTRPAGLAAVLLAVVACGPAVMSPSPLASETSTAPPPSLDTALAILTGPWRPAPVQVDTSLVTAIEHVCKNNADPALAASLENVPVALVDARGDSLVSLILADEHVAYECRADTSGRGSRSKPARPSHASANDRAGARQARKIFSTSIRPFASASTSSRVE